MAKWAHLMDLLEKKRRILNGFNDMLEMFRQIESTALELKDMEVRIFVRLRSYSRYHLPKTHFWLCILPSLLHLNVLTSLLMLMLSPFNLRSYEL